MVSSETRYVQLKNGPVVPVEPILLMFDLQDRGFSLTRESGDVLSVQPWQKLMPADVQAVKRWKFHILALLSYEPPEVQ